MEKKNDNKTKKIILAVAILAVAVAALLLAYRFTRPDTQAGQKRITLEVVHKDGTSKTFQYQTDAEHLGEVLKAEKIAEGEDGPYGMFITAVDGETADDGAQEWWCLTKGGEQVNTSADQTVIADGEKYELTLTVGY